MASYRLQIGDVVARLGHSRLMLVVEVYPGHEIVDVEWAIGHGRKRRVESAVAFVKGLRLIRRPASIRQ